jgi:hypothetical protein
MLILITEGNYMLEFQKNWNKMIWEQNLFLIKTLSLHGCTFQQPFMPCAIVPLLLNLPTSFGPCDSFLQNGLCFLNGNKN